MQRLRRARSSEAVGLGAAPTTTAPAIGNRRLQASLQAKLRVSEAGSPAEREADRVAAHVMRMPEPTAPVRATGQQMQRCPGGCPDDEVRRQPLEEEELMRAAQDELLRQPLEEEEELLQPARDMIAPESMEEEVMAETGGTGRAAVDAVTADAIATARGGGSGLPPAERAFFEPRFGTDFGAVRVHDGAAAAGLAGRVNARAFTVGRDVFFGEREYRPGTGEGRRLLAHELTHVVQQRGGMERISREEEGEGGGGGGGGGGSAPRPTDPCGGSSVADSFTPTARGATASVGTNAFGTTSKLAAFPQFEACRVGSTWRFHLSGLRVPVASDVQAANFRTEVGSASDSVVTASTWRAIVSDLAASRSVRFGVSCGGQRYTDAVSDYSRRRTYWKRQLVVDHEAFHRSDWIAHYRPELKTAEEAVWQHSIPASSARNARDAVTRARSALIAPFPTAYQNTCTAYAPDMESRAYAAGASDYNDLADAVRQRAQDEGWS